MKFKSVVFDIEADNLLPNVTKVHCIVIKCLITNEVISCADIPTYPPIAEALKILSEAEKLVGHNIKGYDIPALKKIYPEWTCTDVQYDTLLLSRLMFSHVIDIDFNRKVKGMPFSMYGRHSLEAWGYRLGEYKGDFGKETDWKNWTPKMQEYCEQDVEVTDKLYGKLKLQEYSADAIKLEHDFFDVINWQINNGVPFNKSAAIRLRDEVSGQLEHLKQQLQAVVPPFVEETEFIPKRDNRTLGYKKDVPIIKRKKIIFNPGSRQQIIRFLKSKYLWNPVDFTDKNNPKVGREQLEPLSKFAEVPLLIEYLDAHKLSGQLYNGKNAWLKLVTKEGRIHGGVITNGAITGRCTHNTPNLAQVPTVRSFKGEECRALFYAPSGSSFVGADASGLELRMLAHYLAQFDGGAYTKQILTGDIHTHNQEAAGLPTRDNAKTFIYAFNYGAGDAKLGSIVEPTSPEYVQKSVGKELRMRFLAKLPAIRRLQDAVKLATKRKGFLSGLDGRKLMVRSEHRALNTLLQGGGSVVMKVATVLLWQEADRSKAYPVLHVHDEYQSIAETSYADELGEIKVASIVNAGINLKLRCPLDGEYKIGNNWKETH